MNNLVKKSDGSKTLKSSGLLAYMARYGSVIDIGGENKNATVSFGCSDHTGYSNICYLQGSNDNSTFTTIDTVNVPADFTVWWSYDSSSTYKYTYGCFLKTLYNQPYRYYKMTFSTPDSHGLGSISLNVIWEE